MLLLGAVRPCVREACGIRSGAPRGRALRPGVPGSFSRAALRHYTGDSRHECPRVQPQCAIERGSAGVASAYPTAMLCLRTSAKRFSCAPGGLRHLTNASSDQGKAVAHDGWLGQPPHYTQTKGAGSTSVTLATPSFSSVVRPFLSLAELYRCHFHSRRFLGATVSYCSSSMGVLAPLTPSDLSASREGDSSSLADLVSLRSYRRCLSSASQRPSSLAKLPETCPLSPVSARGMRQNEVSFSQPLQAPISFTPSVPYPSDKPVPLDSPLSPSVHAAPQVRRPGSVVRMNEVIRHWWSIPAVGFNGVLEVPIYKFEVFQRREANERDEEYSGNEGKEIQRPAATENEDEEGCIVLPNDIFGLPLRPDILYRCYWFYRRAIAGWTERMQLFKWEWPGSKRKLRPQCRTGMARIGWRKAPGKYVGVKAHPLRPHDQRIKVNKRILWQGLKIMLSAKFAQGQIKVVDHFNLQSHKTKHCVQHLRRLLGRKCPSALLVHEGTTDVNDNFRYATAHILAVRRENVEGVNVYNLLKYRQLVITEKALLKLIYNIEKYPEKRGWLPKYATPDGRPAPVPEKVEGWDREWQEKKERERTASYNRALLRERILKWKWSDETKGAMKVPRVDPFKGFRLARFSLHEPSMPWEKYGETYVDTEPLETEQDDFDAFDDLRESMEVRERLQRLDEEELPPSLVSDGLSPEDTPLNERRRTIPKDFYGEVPAEDDGKLVRPCQIKEGESVRLPDEGEEDSQWENCSSLPPVDRYSEKQRR